MAPQVTSAAGFSADVLEFIRLLRRFKVHYLVVGGEAVIFHGYPRLTGDIDFYFQRTAGNVARLFKALEVFWDNNIPGIKTAKELLEPGIIIQFGRPPNRIDLHGQIDGVSFAAAWKSRVAARLETRAESIPLFYIGIDALRRNKRATGRPRDLDDLEHLVPARRLRRSAPQGPKKVSLGRGRRQRR